MPTQTGDAEHDLELALESIVLHPGDHVGVFYRGDQERDAFVLPLITTAVGANCGVIYVCDRTEPEQVGRQLLAESAGVDHALERDQLRLVASSDAYFATGCFDPYRMVDFYKSATHASSSDGYSIPCVIGEMSWSLRGCPGSERLIEYEALYAQEFDTSPAITLCLYDLEQTKGEQIVELLRLHSRVVLNGIEMLSPHIKPTFVSDRTLPQQ